MAETEVQGTFSSLMNANQSRKQPSNQATTQATKQPPNSKSSGGDLVETIRSLIKQANKNTSSHRFSEVEKSSLDDIVYSLKKQGFKTSENEVVRIAVNYIVEDFNKSAEDSLLQQVVERLNS